MWEAIAKVLTNQNAFMVMIYGLIVFLIMVVLAKMGWLRLNTSKFGLGDDYRERDIIRQQTEWAHIYCEGLRHTYDDIERPATANPYPEPVKSVKFNSRGNDVRWLQVELNRYGYKLIVDGIAGAKTIEALKDYQRKHNLLDDGICGPLTRLSFK